MLNKTDKGRQELLPGQRTLGQRERAILLVADGRKATASLHALFHGDGRAIVEALVAGGYLAEESTATVATPAAAAPTLRGSVDTFSGPRSLASARMFLFDLSDRMFAPRDRALADRYRNALREARDADAMLAVAREMLSDIEQHAGADRAQSVAERLFKVLPSATAEAA
ncbi:MAG: hypothetical protein KF871_13760 [Hydrogenophaga sp.]|uniref:hypothetical protein n=1 Tax=Hydrogenophaga sp. TaxID=1904254 RepID=UPI001D6B7BE0|nr:hypothetical protein [Hydrogenophaga sp.]MBX3610952.1 hypothetical protein [Hydrogenophaga sp.]